MANTPARSIAEVVRSENERLTADPNVVAVGYGLRLRGGQVTYEVVVQYHVVRKSPQAELARLRIAPLPESVEGYSTDVVEVHAQHGSQCPVDRAAPTGDRGSRKEEPLVGGTSTTVLSDWHSIPTGYGTLGGICFDSGDNAALGLSNAHVWGQDTGKNVIQPWMPTGEYLEGLAKLLTCGPAAFIFDLVIPSPLTAGLAAAAAAAWIAAAASDAEDPSRWGQRTGGIPAAGQLTSGEVIEVRAELPRLPFAGRAYQADTRWEYERQTSGGPIATAIDATRANEHVLYGKRAWTELPTYQGGDRVEICAELYSARATQPGAYFVVANCYPLDEPDQIVRRILRPASCEKRHETKPQRLSVFPAPAAANDKVDFPLRVGDIVFDSEGIGSFDPDAAGNPLLVLPPQPVRVIVPPCSYAEIEIAAGRVEVDALNSAGQVVASAVVAQGDGLVGLSAPEIVELGLRTEKAILGQLCLSDRPWQGAGKEERISRLGYRGSLELPAGGPLGRWGVLLSVQTVDRSATGSDPIAAARVLGGITASGNVAELGGCIVIELLDHVFDVI